MEIKFNFRENSPAIFTINAKAAGEEFKVYWNAPTFQCHKHGLMFDDLTRNYGIVTNDGGSFRGNFISILYDPGKFPALLKQQNENQLYRRNGGVPQEGSLRDHLDEFRKQLEELIPDGRFSGTFYEQIYYKNCETLFFKLLFIFSRDRNHRFRVMAASFPSKFRYIKTISRSLLRH